jgi:adenylate cyclase
VKLTLTPFGRSVQLDTSSRSRASTYVPSAALVGLQGRRRLAAIVAADVVGYTRLMELNEEETYTRLMHLKKTVLDPIVSSFNGRVFKDTGDGFVTAFETIDTAMQAATAMQRAVIAQEKDRHPEHRITFRMGAHIADVIEQDDDLYGDGVNVAVRLQSYAEPGGIAISGAIAEHAGGIGGMHAVDLGQIYLRNRSRPVRLISLRADPGSS